RAFEVLGAPRAGGPRSGPRGAERATRDAGCRRDGGRGRPRVDLRRMAGVETRPVSLRLPTSRQRAVLARSRSGGSLGRPGAGREGGGGGAGGAAISGAAQGR